MRVLYVLHSSHASEGSSKAALSLVRGCKQYGVQPYVVMPGRYDLYDKMKGEGVNVLSLNYRCSTYPYLRSVRDYLLFLPRLLARLCLNGLAMQRIAKLVKEHKIELVHTNVSVVDIGYRVAMRAGIPHVYHIREYAEKIGMHHFPSASSFSRQLHRGKPSYSIAITKALAAHYQLSNNPTCRIVYDGVLPRNELSILPKERYFLYAGRMQYVKGVDLLLRGYADYARSTSNPVPLYLAGPLDTGRYQQVVSSIVSENRLSDLVRFLGERDDVTALMSHALALIVPSRFEGFGLCMPEAMFNGCLVIAHQAYGLAEQLENGREMHGADIALSYQSVQELTQLLDEVATRGIMPFMPLIHRAHATACSLYSSEVHVENVCSFYQYIYSQSHGGA